MELWNEVYPLPVCDIDTHQFGLSCNLKSGNFK